MNWKQTASGRRLACLAGALIFMAGFGGCGQLQSRSSDPIEGRKALQTVLEAWKGGEKPDALAQRTPPIHVTDGDWMSGFRLQDYKADDEGKLVGSDVSYNVVLELKTDKGSVVKRNAVYSVTTHPLLLVVRQDRL